MSTPQNEMAVGSPLARGVHEQVGSLVEPTKISVEQLLGALDTQIKFEASNLRNEGWTRWALWGAIAALVWIATDLWAQPTLSLSRMVGIALFIFVLWKFLEKGIWILLPITRIEVGPARFHPAANTIHPLRLEMMVDIAQNLLVVGALIYLKFPSQWFLWLYALCALGGSAFALCFGRLIIGTPTKVVSLIARINFLSCIQLVILTGAGWQIWAVIHSNFAGYSLADVRLALVLSAITFLVSRLVVATSSEHLLSKLTQLRQHLAFDRISLQEANEKTAELLTGITLKKLLNPFIQVILDEEAKLQALLVEAEQTLDKANTEMIAPEPKPHEALRLLDLMGSPPAKVAQQLKQNKRAWGRFAGRAVIFAIYSQESRSEIKAITDQVRSQLADVDAKLKECYSKYYSLKKEALELANEFV